MDGAALTRGLRADGVGTVLGGVFNTFPYTSFSQNVGLVGVTGVRSRWVTVAGGAIMLLLGLLPKMAALVESVPQVVLGGAGLVMFGMVAATGARILTKVDFRTNHYNLFVVAVSVGFGMIPLVAPNFFRNLPHGCIPCWIRHPAGRHRRGAAERLLQRPRQCRRCGGVCGRGRCRGRTRLTGGRPMTLLSKTYGKGRVRVMRIHKDGDRREVRELTVLALVTGDFGGAFTDADNSTSICTDTVRNVVNVVAREDLTAGNEAFCAAVAQKLLDNYAQLDSVTVTAHETRWDRLSLDGAEHPHAFTLDANGRPFARVAMPRGGATVTESGVSGFTFLKATESGWAGYVKDPLTTLAETHDRIAATSMEASWRWAAAPADYAAANATILHTMLRVFATTYSHSVQDSLYRMGMAALAAVPEVEQISMACPNKHYIPLNLAPFGLDNANQVFVATDEPHGQIECTVGR